MKIEKTLLLVYHKYTKNAANKMLYIRLFTETEGTPKGKMYRELLSEVCKNCYILYDILGTINRELYQRALIRAEKIADLKYKQIKKYGYAYHAAKLRIDKQVKAGY